MPAHRCVRLTAVALVERGGRFAVDRLRSRAVAGAACCRSGPTRTPAKRSPPRSKAGSTDPDGSVSLLVGYFNRNSKQALDIPIGPEQPHRAGRPRLRAADALPAGPPVGRVHDPAAEGLRRQEAHLDDRRQRPDHQHPAERAPAVSGRAVRRERHGQHAAGAALRAGRRASTPVRRSASRRRLTATVGEPLTLTAWVTDKPAKIIVNVPRPPGGGGGRGRAPRPDLAADVEHAPRSRRTSPSARRSRRSTRPPTARRRPPPPSARPATTSCARRRNDSQAKAAAGFSAAGRTRT